MIEAEPQSYERILSSMCTEPHPDAVSAAHTFLASNPGDPATFPPIAELETRVVSGLGELAGHEDPAGYVASGGTEANIQAVHVARNRADNDRPNMVIPANGHFSFAKAGELLGVEVRWSDLDDSMRADVDDMAERIDSNTVLLAGVAGSTEYGRVDPIPDIAGLARDEGIHCHVDAAWGGFLLPFTDQSWNFADAPIDSLTIDPHKFGRAAIPAGGFLVRSADYLRALAVETPYLESHTQVTLSGTRSGAGVASAAAAIDAMWPDGYEQQYHRAMTVAERCARELRQRGFDVIEPRLPLVSTEFPDDIFRQLRHRGWRIARTTHGELRIVCMPHVTMDRLQSFLADVDRVMPAATDHV